jgi:hypothetical protein
MALMDSFGLESRTVCYPQHILLRIRKGEREIDMESTLYGDPVVYPYPPDLPERAAQEGFIYGRSLNRMESAWLYLTDLLWAWAPLRSKDFHSFWLLERAEEVLDGSAEVICFQWALRHQLRSVRPAIPAADRAESLRIAVEDYERVIHWDPDDGMSYLLLSVAYEDYGDRSSCLRTLRRYVDRHISPATSISTFIEARWWIKRVDLAVPEFLPDFDERKRGEAFLAEHYPSRDRAVWLESQVRRWFVPKEP